MRLARSGTAGAAVTPAAAGAVYRGANRAAETRSLFRALEIKPALAPEGFFRLALMALDFWPSN
jgi:hypothetical protein